MDIKVLSEIAAECDPQSERYFNVDQDANEASAKEDEGIGSPSAVKVSQDVDAAPIKEAKSIRSLPAIKVG